MFFSSDYFTCSELLLILVMLHSFLWGKRHCTHEVHVLTPAWFDWVQGRSEAPDEEMNTVAMGLEEPSRVGCPL